MRNESVLKLLKKMLRENVAIAPVFARKNELAPLFARFKQYGLEQAEEKSRFEQADVNHKNLQTQLERDEETGKAATSKLATVQRDVLKKTQILDQIGPDKGTP